MLRSTVVHDTAPPSGLALLQHTEILPKDIKVHELSFEKKKHFAIMLSMNHHTFQRVGWYYIYLSVYLSINKPMLYSVQSVATVHVINTCCVGDHYQIPSCAVMHNFIVVLTQKTGN